MSDREHAAMMFRMAEMDLNTLELMLREPLFSEEAFGFHAQQATEKALKAWIIALQLDCPRRHDLETLMDLLRFSGKDLPSQFQTLGDFTAFGVEFRYWTCDPLAKPIERPAVVALIHDLFVFIKQQLNAL